MDEAVVAPPRAVAATSSSASATRPAAPRPRRHGDAAPPPRRPGRPSSITIAERPGWNGPPGGAPSGELRHASSAQQRLEHARWHRSTSNARSSPAQPSPAGPASANATFSRSSTGSASRKTVPTSKIATASDPRAWLRATVCSSPGVSRVRRKRSSACRGFAIAHRVRVAGRARDRPATRTTAADLAQPRSHQRIAEATAEHRGRWLAAGLARRRHAPSRYGRTPACGRPPRSGRPRVRCRPDSQAPRPRSSRRPCHRARWRQTEAVEHGASIVVAHRVAEQMRRARGRIATQRRVGAPPLRVTPRSTRAAGPVRDQPRTPRRTALETLWVGASLETM